MCLPLNFSLSASYFTIASSGYKLVLKVNRMHRPIKKSVTVCLQFSRRSLSQIVRATRENLRAAVGMVGNIRPYRQVPIYTSPVLRHAERSSRLRAANHMAE